MKHVRQKVNHENRKSKWNVVFGANTLKDEIKMIRLSEREIG